MKHRRGAGHTCNFISTTKQGTVIDILLHQKIKYNKMKAKIRQFGLDFIRVDIYGLLFYYFIKDFGSSVFVRM